MRIQKIEICRQGLNVGSVGRFRASRDIPLPYSIDTPSTTSVETIKQTPADTLPTAQVDLERQDHTASTSPGTQRRPSRAATPLQRGMSRVGALMSEAHAQDFERRKRPGVEDEHTDHEQEMHNSSSEEEEEDELYDENQHDIADAESLVTKQKRRV